MGEPNEHIAAWEAAGLIDAATAARLRAAATGATASDDLGSAHLDRAVAEDPVHRARAAAGPSQVGAMFGPSVTIPEVFGYLGTAFLLAAWSAWAVRGPSTASSLVPGLAALVASVVLIALGLALRGGDDRRSRAAGSAFLVAVAYAGVGFTALAGTTSMSPEQAGLIGAGVALAVAVALRGLHPAVLTQVGLLAAISALTAVVLVWAQATFLPSPTVTYDELGNASVLARGTDPLILVIATAVWWLCCAVVIGLIGLAEARAADRGDAAAARRAAVSRFWAGIVAVLGLASAVTRSELDVDTNDYGRVLEPWLGQLALLLLSLVLLERAFRRDSTAYVYAAALGLILALSDFNVTYLSDTTEVALAIEGAILLGVGFGADRLRRRIGRGDEDPGAEAPGADAPGDDAPNPPEADAGRLAVPIDDVSPAGDPPAEAPAPSG